MSSVAAGWRASYRLQLHAGFGFEEALAQLPYLEVLGISHLYLSPILTSRQGSMHGYDVVDHGAVDPELGGEAGYRRLVEGLRAHGMGVVVDIVPNHMAVGGDDNALWLDVLERGPKSAHAGFFDIDWDVPDVELNGRVLVPLLGESYGECLSKGLLSLRFDANEGRFFFEHYEHRFPLAATLYAPLLRASGSALASFAAAFRTAKTDAAFAAAREALRQAAPTDINALLQRFAAGTRRGEERLHRLLSRQHYRLSGYRTAADEINWRRFFDVTTLAGVPIEEPAVFERVHATTLRLYAEGLIDGLRIDHVDGLADPRGYCVKLRERLTALEAMRPASAPRGAAYVVVEKILAEDEALPADWRVDGTTGYSFMNSVAALAHDARAEPGLRGLWVDETGRSGDFEAEVRAARRRIPQDLLAADFNACARAFHALARADRATRDWALNAIRRVLVEVLVELPVYRSYIDANGRSAADAEMLAQTFAAARPRLKPSEQPLLELFDRWLGGVAPRRARSLNERRLQLRAIARFQQLSSPVAAKSVEDTAFYRFGLLLSRNEVGANPRQFALDAETFHAEMARRAEGFPFAMLATATHDHKRGEDARMRLAALSEAPELWLAAVHDWCAQHEAAKPVVENVKGPDAADELMLYQMLFAIWPFAHEGQGLHLLAERVQAWQEKSIREAKRHTGWLEPNAPYEAACKTFVSRLLASPDFVRAMDALVARYAAGAAVKSLVQTLLKLTAPGLPDFYQGTELWDFSMVDPDNRRAVDYAWRAANLAAARPDAELMAQWQDGAVKQQLVARVLAARAGGARLFTAGRHRPLPAGEALLAFAREADGQRAIVIVPRWPLVFWQGPGNIAAAGKLPEPTIALPAEWPRETHWRSVLDDRRIGSHDGHLHHVWAQWPVALLIEEPSP